MTPALTTKINLSLVHLSPTYTTNGKVNNIQAILASPSRVLIKGDSPEDQFLLSLISRGSLDEDLAIQLRTGEILPKPKALTPAQIQELVLFLTTPRRYTIEINQAKKAELRKMIYLDRGNPAHFPCVHGEKTEQLTCTFTLVDLFHYLFASDRRMNFSSEDRIKLVGGFARNILKDWIRKTAALWIPEQIIPSCDDLKTSSKQDKDLRYTPKLSDISDLNDLAVEFLTSQFFPHISDHTSTTFKNCSYILRILNFFKIEGIYKGTLEDSDIVASTSFGMSDRVDLAFAQRLKRECLFSTDHLHIPLKTLIHQILTGFSEDLSITPHGESDIKIWQAIVDCLGKLIHADLPEQIDKNGWIRFIAAISKKYRCPVISKKISSILFKAMCPGFNPTLPTDRIRLIEKVEKDIKHYYENHDKGNQTALMSIVFNAFQSLKEESVESEIIEQIWLKISSLFEKESQDNFFCLIKEALDLDSKAFETVSAFLQCAAFLKAHGPQGQSNGTDCNVYLTEHEGEPVLQFLQENSLLLPCNLDKALDILTKSSHLNPKVMEKLGEILLRMLPQVPMNYDYAKSQISRNLDQLDSSISDSVTHKILKLTQDKQTPSVVIDLCNHLLLQIELLKSSPNDAATEYLLSQLTKMIFMETTVKAKEKLLFLFAVLIKNSKYAAILESEILKTIFQTIKDEEAIEDSLTVNWILALANTYEKELNSLAILIWTKVSFKTDERKKECGLALFNALLTFDPSSAYQIYSALHKLNFFKDPTEAYTVFVQSLSPKNYDRYSLETLARIESIISALITSLDSEQTFLSSTQLAALLDVLNRKTPSRKTRELLSKATELKIIPTNCLETVKAWMTTCEACLISQNNHLDEACLTWKLATNLHIPFNKEPSIRLSLLLSDLYAQLLSSDDPEALILSETFSDLLFKKMKDPANHINKEDILKIIASLFPEKPTQAVLLIHHLFSLNKLSQEEVYQELKTLYQKLNNHSAISLPSLLALEKIYTQYIANKSFLTSAKKRPPSPPAATPSLSSKFATEFTLFLQELLKNHQFELAKKLLLSATVPPIIIEKELVACWLALCQSAIDSNELQVETLWSQARNLNIWKLPHHPEEKNQLLITICKKLIPLSSESDALKDLLESAGKELNDNIKEKLSESIDCFLSSQLAVRQSRDSLEKIEKSLQKVLTPDQQQLINLEKLRIDIREKNWSKVIPALSLSTKNCSDSLKPVLIQLLKQVVQEFSNLKPENQRSLEQLIKEQTFQQLFIDRPQDKINLLLDAIEIALTDLNTHYRFAINASQSLLQSLSNITLTHESTSRLAFTLIQLIETPCPSAKIVLSAIEKNLRNVLSPLVNLLCTAEPNPNLLPLCRLLKVLSLYLNDIVYSKPMLQNIFSSASLYLERSVTTSEELETIHEALDSLKCSNPNKPQLSELQVKAYLALVKKLIQKITQSPHLSKHVDSWILRILINLKGLQFNLIDGPTLLQWVEKFHQQGELSKLRCVYQTKLKIDNLSMAKILYLFAQDFSKENPQETTKILIDHGKLFKTYETSESTDLALLIAQQLLREFTQESMMMAWKLNKEYALIGKIRHSDLFEPLLACFESVTPEKSFYTIQLKLCRQLISSLSEPLASEHISFLTEMSIKLMRQWLPVSGLQPDLKAAMQELYSIIHNNFIDQLSPDDKQWFEQQFFLQNLTLELTLANNDCQKIKEAINRFKFALKTTPLDEEIEHACLELILDHLFIVFTSDENLFFKTILDLIQLLISKDRRALFDATQKSLYQFFINGLTSQIAYHRNNSNATLQRASMSYIWENQNPRAPELRNNYHSDKLVYYLHFFTKKCLMHSSKDLHKDIALINFAAAAVEFFIKHYPNRHDIIVPMLEQILYHPSVHTTDLDGRLFAAHESLIKVLFNALSKMTVSPHYSVILTTLGIYIGHGMAFTGNEVKVVETLISRLVSTPTSNNLKHVMNILGCHLPSLSNSIDFSNVYVPLIRFIQLNPHLKIMIQSINTEIYLFEMLVNKVFQNPSSKYFAKNVLMIYTAMVETYLANPSLDYLLLTINNYLNVAFQHNHLKGHYEEFYLFIKECCPLFSQKINPNPENSFEVENSPFNLTSVFTYNVTQTIGEKRVGTGVLGVWLLKVAEGEKNLKRIAYVSKILQEFNANHYFDGFECTYDTIFNFLKKKKSIK